MDYKVIQGNAFLYAARNGIFSVEHLEDMLNEEPQLVTFTNDAGATALHIASSVNRPRIVSFLLERGLDPNVDNLTGQNALHYAAKSNCLETVNLLLAAGCVVTRDNMGETALLIATAWGSLDIVKRLLVHLGHQDPYWHVSQDGNLWPVNVAASQGRTDIICTLLEHSTDQVAEVNLVCQTMGRTALHSAASKGHTRTVKQLLHSGANVHIKDNQNQTALDCTGDGLGKEEIMALLVSFGAVPNDGQISRFELVKELPFDMSFFFRLGKDARNKMTAYFSPLKSLETLTITSKEGGIIPLAHITKVLLESNLHMKLKRMNLHNVSLSNSHDWSFQELINAIPEVCELSMMDVNSNVITTVFSSLHKTRIRELAVDASPGMALALTEFFEHGQKRNTKLKMYRRGKWHKLRHVSISEQSHNAFYIPRLLKALSNDEMVQHVSVSTKNFGISAAFSVRRLLEEKKGNCLLSLDLEICDDLVFGNKHIMDIATGLQHNNKLKSFSMTTPRGQYFTIKPILDNLILGKSEIKNLSLNLLHNETILFTTEDETFSTFISNPGSKLRSLDFQALTIPPQKANHFIQALPRNLHLEKFSLGHVLCQGTHWPLPSLQQVICDMKNLQSISIHFKNYQFTGDHVAIKTSLLEAMKANNTISNFELNPFCLELDENDDFDLTFYQRLQELCARNKNLADSQNLGQHILTHTFQNPKDAIVVFLKSLEKCVSEIQRATMMYYCLVPILKVLGALSPPMENQGDLDQRARKRKHGK